MSEETADSQGDVMAGSQAFCFVTRLASYWTIMADSRDEAQQKGNRNIAYGPVNFCHDGACRHEGDTWDDAIESCDGSA